MYDEITLEGEDNKWGIIGVLLLGIVVMMLYCFTLILGTAL